MRARPGAARARRLVADRRGAHGRARPRDRRRAARSCCSTSLRRGSTRPRSCASESRSRRYVTETGCTVLLVEHNAGFVMEQSDRVVVLNLGTVLARGSARRGAAQPGGARRLPRRDRHARAAATRGTARRDERVLEPRLLRPGHRRDLLDHGVGTRADLHDVGHLQLRARRSGVRHRVSLLPAEHRPRRAHRARR